MNHKDLASPVIRKTAIDKDGIAHYLIEGGMTKREAFALAAMQGILASCGVDTYLPDDCARHAANYADELLIELANTDPKNATP